MVGCVPNASIAAKLAAQAQIDMTDLDPEIQAIGEQFRGWLEKAQQSGQGIVTFYY